jgi:lactate permease
MTVRVLMAYSFSEIPVWTQSYDPLHHWWLSSALAALPIVLLLTCIAGFKLKAHIAALLALIVTLLLALTLFHMPVSLALISSAYGALYGLFPVSWIVLPILFLYQLTVQAGRFELLRTSLISVTPDSRLQLLLIAFAFGAFFEGASGFGTPVAVCGAILVELGFSPLQAAGLSLLANTAPVAFGSLGIPIVALHGVTGFDMFVLSKAVGRLLTPFCLIVPFWLIWAHSGLVAMLEIWPAALVAGSTFALVQLLISNLTGPWLVDIGASLITILVLVVFLRVWKPKTIRNPQGIAVAVTEQSHKHSRETLVKAWAPWLLLTLFVVIWGLPSFAHYAESLTYRIPVFGLHNHIFRVPPIVATPIVEPAVFVLNWLSAAGTSIFLAAICSGLLMRLSMLTIARTFIETLFIARFTVITIATMMALGFVIRYCGLDATLGLAFARTGLLYPFFGTLVGWLGTASTGSDTSSNVLFGGLQKLTAQQIHVSPVLMCSANSCGGVMAKMVSPQSIVIASTATKCYGSEGSILRSVFLHSIALAVLMGVTVTLIAYVKLFHLLVP